MKNICCLLLLALLTGTTAIAQKKNGFYNIDEAGIQFSEANGAVFRAIGGYRFGGHYQAGLGVGLDLYSIRSVPLFADLRYNLNSTQNSVFFYGGAGVSMPWPTRNQYNSYTEGPDKTSPGFYGHVGVGYKMKMGKHSFHFAGGYSRAAMKLKYESYSIWPFPTDIAFNTYEYKFNRISIVAGVTL